MMSSHDVMEVLAFLERGGVSVWVDGSRGVEALLGEQTHEHTDLDLGVEWSHAGRFNSIVANHGFRFLCSDGPLNWVVEDDRGRQIDVHLVDTSVPVQDSGGRRVCGPRGLPYDVGAFEAAGSILGGDVPCCTAEFQAWSLHDDRHV